MQNKLFSYTIIPYKGKIYFNTKQDTQCCNLLEIIWWNTRKDKSFFKLLCLNI